MRILRASDYQRMPWKNGGGETIQIAIDDGARGLDDFIWRISMARVETDGPFSLFPGIDRTLCVLDGDSLVLSVADRTSIVLTRTSAPYFFPADIPVDAQLPRGGITDLNVMTRRGRARHFVSKIRHGSAPHVALQGDCLMVLSIGGECHLRHGGSEDVLADRDFAIIPAGQGSPEIAPTQQAILIDLWLT